MTTAPGWLLSRSLRFKLLLLISGPLLVAGLFGLGLLEGRLGPPETVDLQRRGERIAERTTEILEEASRICGEALVSTGSFPEARGLLAGRLEGIGLLDAGLNYLRWDGTPPGAPAGLGRAREDQWRVHSEGVRTRLLVAAGPNERGHSVLATFVIDSDLGDLPFSDLLSPDLEQGVDLDIRFVDSRFVDSDRDLPEQAILDEYGLVAPLRSPSGVTLAVLSLQAIPASHAAARMRTAGRAWGLLLSLALVALLFDWRRICRDWRGLLTATGALILARFLLSWARVPAVLLPRELGSASIYGSSEAWRLLASPADLFLTTVVVFLFAKAVRAWLAARAESARGAALALSWVSAATGTAVLIWLSVSLAHNSRVPVFGGPQLWRIDAATVLSLGLVLAGLAAAEMWAMVWTLGRGLRLVGGRRPHRVPVVLAFLLMVLASSAVLQRLNDRLIFVRLNSELAPQVLEQTDRRAVALSAAVQHVLESYASEESATEQWGRSPKFMAHHFWAAGELFHGGYRSSLDFYTPNGDLISHFGFDVPELDEAIGGPEPPPTTPRITREVLPLSPSVQQSLLHLESPVVRRGEALGFVVGHVLDEPDNLPFLPWSRPYISALGPGSRDAVADDLLRDLNYVRYDAHGTVLVTTLLQPPAQTEDLLRSAAEARPVYLESGDEAYTGVALQERDGLHLLLVPGRSLLERSAAAVRLALLGLGLLALLTLAPRLLRRSGVVELAQAVRESFHRKLQAALLVASIVPLIGLALFLRGYIDQRGVAALDNSAIQFVSAAQRQLEDYSSVQLENDAGRPEFNDNLLYWMRRVLGQEIHVYENDRLVASSKRELFASGLLEPRLDGAVRRGLVEEGLPYLVRRMRIGATEIPVAYAPVRSVDPPGQLVVAVPLVTTQRQIERAVGRVVEMILLATVLLVGLLAVVAAYLARTVARPVRELAEATGAIAAGDYGTRLEARTEDEVADLVGGFNSMASALATQRADLERRKDYIEALLRHATTGVISTDAMGRIVTLNPAARQLLAGGDALNAGAELAGTLGRSEALAPLADALQTRRSRSGEPLEIDLDGDGEPRRLRLVQVDLPGASGEPVGTLILLDDVTELMRSNQLAAWAEMARAIAHEIKNPLTPIQLSAEHLERLLLDGGVLPAPKIEACLQTIIKQVRTLYQISGEFSAYAKLPDLAPEPADPAEFLRATLDPYRAANLQTVEIEERYAAASRVSIDHRVLSRAVINLIENALQAMPDGGRLTVSVEEDTPHGEVVLSISDTGTGLDSEARSRLFEPYFSTKSSGTGLGLAIVRRAVEAHHGAIDVESEPGKGTVFHIRLPVVTPGSLESRSA